MKENKYLFIETSSKDNKIVYETSNYEDAYKYQVKLVGKDNLMYYEVSDPDDITEDTIIRYFGHPNVVLVYSYKYHNRRLYNGYR